MKRYGIAAAAAFCLLISGCSQEKKSEQMTVYTTVFPFKSFIEQIGGKYVDVKSIYPNGIDVHTFEPTQKDTLAVAKSDLFVYSSKQLDPVSGKIASAVKDDKKLLAVAADLKESQLLAHHDHNEEEHEHQHEAEPASDPHVWLDPVLDQKFALKIKKELIAKDPDHKNYYTKNYDQLISDLKDIDHQMKSITQNPKRDTVYISHESLGYLANRYHFKEVGVSGMNNDEPSQHEIVSMINDINDLKVPYLLYEQNIPSKITDIIRSKTSTKALKFHNMSVLTDDEAKNNDLTYQKLMKEDIRVLDHALNQ